MSSNLSFTSVNTLPFSRLLGGFTCPAHSMHPIVDIPFVDPVQPSALSCLPMAAERQQHPQSNMYNSEQGVKGLIFVHVQIRMMGVQL